MKKSTRKPAAPKPTSKKRGPASGFFLSGFLPAVRVTANDERAIRAAARRASPPVSVGEFVRRAVKEKLERERR